MSAIKFYLIFVIETVTHFCLSVVSPEYLKLFYVNFLPVLFAFSSMQPAVSNVRSSVPQMVFDYLISYALWFIQHC